MGGVFSAAEILIAHDALAQRDGCFHSADDCFIEGALHTGDGSGTVWTHSDEFSNHRVVERRDGVTAINVGIHTDANAPGGVVKVDRAWRRPEIVGGILGVDSEFDGVA